MNDSLEQNPFRSPVDANAEDDRPNARLWLLRLGWQLPLATLLLFLVGGVLRVVGLPVVISLGLGLTGLVVYLGGIFLTIYGLYLTNSTRGIERNLMAGILVNMFVLLGLPCTFGGISF